MSRAFLGICAALMLSTAAVCQCEPSSGPQGGNQLARAVVENELKAEDVDHARWMYRLQTRKGHTIEVSEVVETKDGSLWRQVAVNGHPLTAQEQQNEDERIQKLLQDRARHKKEQQSRREDSDQARKLLQMLPDAFDFSCAGTEGKLVKLNFVPNPNFRPSSRQAKVFHDMVGSVWVDPQEKRLAGIAGRLMKEVKFGGGLLGHLDQGGEFFVKQTEITPGHWDMTRLRVNMHGKALFFKTISVQQDEMRSDYHQVPENLTLSQAAEMLKKQTSVVARKR
jgi:hypothetical protein